jgi:hypothetical protein
VTASAVNAPPTGRGDDHAAQARRALRSANRKRLVRATIRRDVRDGTLTLEQIVAERPNPLRPMPLFALLLELPGFGRRRLDKLNRRAIADGINLARTLGDASTATLDWLVQTVDGQTQDDCATSERDAATPVNQAPDAQLHLLHGVVGIYHAADSQRRRLVLCAADDNTLVLVDRGRDDERVVERFSATAGLLEVAAVARGYLDEARRAGRPVVAVTEPTAATRCSTPKTALKEWTR